MSPMKQQTRTSKKKKKYLLFIEDHLTNFMHENLCRHTWNCIIQWSNLNTSKEEIKSCLLLPSLKGQSVEQGLCGENLS